MFGLQGDPIANRKVKLDGTLICSLLGAFLRADPENSAYIMPCFRVKQLVDRVGCCHGDDGMFHGPINPNVMEVTGCLFILCFHLASNPNLDGETVFLAARCIHMALGESLQVMHEDPKQRLDIVHPYTLFNKDNAFGVRETFKSALHSAKDITRDTIKQIRQCRETKTTEGTKFDKLDCWQAHSIYFMCSFGLCHVSGVLKSTNNLNIIPGQMEALVLIASLVPKPHKSSSDVVKLFKEESTRFYVLFEWTVAMARAMVHYCYDSRTLQEIKVHKQHFTNVVTDAGCDYSRIKGLAIKATLLGKPNPNLVEDEADLLSRKADAYEYIIAGSETDIPKWYHHRPEKNEEEVGDVPTEFPSSTSNRSRSHSPLPDGSSKPDPQDHLTTTTLSHSRRRGEGESASVSVSGKPGTRGGLTTAGGSRRDETSTRGSVRRLDSAASNKKDGAIMRPSPSTKGGGAAQSEGSTDDVKESQGCWRLRKVYRPAFMCTRYFRKKVTINEYLNENYKPKKLFVKKPYDFYVAHGLSQISLTRAMKRIDSMAFYSDALGICPRYLNPSKGLFWVVVYMLDYIYQATFYGGGFSTDKKSQDRKLRTEMRMARTERAKAIPLSPVRAPGRPLESQTKTKNTLNLQERLNLVAREANAAAQLDTNAKVSREKKRLASLKGQERMQKVDRVLQVGTKTMRQVATEQQSLFEDLYGGDNIYSDTDDDDDYTETESEEEDYDEEGSDEGGATMSSSSKASIKSDGDRSFDENDPTDPFNQLELMQRHRTNELGQAIGETHNGDPLQAYLSEPALHAVTKFRKKLKMSGLVKAGLKNLIETGNRLSSVVWTMKQEKQSDSTRRRLNQGKLSNTEQALLYIEQIRKYQRERNEELVAAQQELEDTQEMEVSKTRAHKLGMVHEARETRRVNQLESAAILAQKAEDKKRSEKLERQAQRLEEKLIGDRERRELSRISDIASHKQEKVREKEQAQAGRHAIESIRIREMHEAKEYQEILRRIREESRMRELEERRRYLDNKDQIDAEAARQKLKERRKKWKEEKEAVMRRIRVGSFMNLGGAGKKGFYDGVRERAPDWVQYQDENGYSYYYDPITKTQTYDVPKDADYHHHSVDDRIAYDAIHGAGSYDEEFWKAQMQASVNQDGGYYDQEGHWQDVNGVFDEDGTFYNYDEGYFDEQNNWILYPQNITDTLDFMV